jgi:hypothetical protein
MSYDDAKRILLLNLQGKPCPCCARAILVEVPLVMREPGRDWHFCRNRCGYYFWHGIAHWDGSAGWRFHASSQPPHQVPDQILSLARR